MSIDFSIFNRLTSTPRLTQLLTSDLEDDASAHNLPPDVSFRHTIVDLEAGDATPSSTRSPEQHNRARGSSEPLKFLIDASHQILTNCS